MKVFYSPDYAAMRYAVSATRKAAWIAESLETAPIDGVVLESPTPASRDSIERVHAPAYVQAVQTGRPKALAQSSTFPWDKGTWIAASARSGGMIAAVRSALTEGAAGNLVPGDHHACHEQGRLYCTFNEVALAATEAADAGVERILHIDVDAHCGGGTYSLLSSRPGYRQMDISLFPTDRYQPQAPSTLDMVERAEDYLPTIHRRLAELESVAKDFQLCLYFAGMDPHEGSAYGGLPGIDFSMLQAREEMIFDWIKAKGMPVAFCLGGGYVGPTLDAAGLVSLHRMTIKAAVRCMHTPDTS